MDNDMLGYQVWFFTGVDERPRVYECVARCSFSAISALLRDEKDVDVSTGFVVIALKTGKAVSIRQKRLGLM